MGIPSYYRRLVESVPSLIGKVQLGTSCDWLWIDFNCIVYHCLRRPGAPVWNGLSGIAEFEAELRRSVIQYVDYLISCAGPVRGVGLAVDGVVPAAKRRQQRLRRVECKEGASAQSWDTNAITPGTGFMNDLMADLERWRVGRVRVRPEMNWLVSPCTEPGEGEHKIMSWLRSELNNNRETHMIYGLDADLILLTMLNNVCYLPNHEFKLYREEQKGGETLYSHDGKEKMLSFSLDSLINYIVEKIPVRDATVADWIKDYVFAMSVLGNDFVPCMMSLSLKDEGHGLLLEMLGRVWRKGGRLCGPSDGWRMLFEEIAMGEKERVVKSALAKRGQAARQEEDGPCHWFAEEALYHTLPSVKGTYLQIRDDWQDVAATRFSGLRGHAASIRQHQAEEYMRGLQWIYNYYMFGPDGLDFDWYYSSWLAPFALDVAGMTSSVFDVSGQGSTMPTPEEQLALVLPKRSWRLLAGSSCETFVEKGSEWFGEPSVYSSICKRARWECHLNMPSPLLRDLRRTISSTER